MKRSDVDKVLIIGSGPIVIGQACEFDYSGTQACKALKKLGYEIVLVNSNPATIMTDPETADVTYIEPLNVERLEQIIAKERPDALLPNLGGQSGLNLCSELANAGVLDKYNVQVIGVQVDAIERGEDRIEFKKSMDALGIEMARSEVAYSVEEALDIADELGYPVVLRPAYTMGGAGGGLVYNKEELKTVCARGLQASLVGQVLVEESILGWEELELEVVRDKDGNMIQTMRSWSTLMPNESYSCVGCHEDNNTAPPASGTVTMALKAGVETLKGDVWQNEEDFDPYTTDVGFDYLEEVQPILDNNCISCHNNKNESYEKINVRAMGESGVTITVSGIETEIFPIQSEWNYRIKKNNNPMDGWNKQKFLGIWSKGKAGFGNRILAVEWETGKALEFPVNLYIQGIDTLGILHQIGDIVSEQLNVYIRKIFIETMDGLFEGHIQLYVHDVEDVNTIIANLQKMEEMKKVVRVEQFEDKP